MIFSLFERRDRSAATATQPTGVARDADRTEGMVADIMVSSLEISIEKSPECLQESPARQRKNLAASCGLLPINQTYLQVANVGCR